MTVLGNYISIKHGFAFKGEHIVSVDNGVVLVTPGNFAVGGGFQEKKCKYYDGEYNDEYVLHADDLIVTMTDLSKQGDTLGYGALVPYKKNRVYLHNQRIGLVKIISPDIDKGFLYWFLRTPFYHSTVVSTSTGSTVKHTSPARIYDVPIMLPSIQEQRRISSTLFALDRKIELNNKINENLEQQAQAFYQELFIDNANSEWLQGTISDLGTVVGGSTPSKAKTEYYTENGIAWITPKDLSINKAKFISHGKNDITELGLKNSSASIMPKGTVLFSSRAPIGYIAIAAGDVTTNQGFKSVIPKPEIGTAFVYYFLKLNLPIIEGMASGSTFKEVSGSTMKNVPAFIPDSETIIRFNDFCKPIFAQQKILEEQNQSLAGLRDTLLPKLMSGEIDVSDLRS